MGKNLIKILGSCLGCIVLMATGPVTAEEEAEEAQGAKVVIYRTQRFAFANRPIVTVNGQPVGLLIPRKRIEVVVEPGRISASAQGPVPPGTFTSENVSQLRMDIASTRPDIEFTAEAGATYYLRGKIVFGPVGRLTPVKPREGEEQSQKLERISCDFGVLDQIEEAVQEGLQLSYGGRAREVFCGVGDVLEVLIERRR